MSTVYYQKNKEGLQKRLMKVIKIYQRKEKTKSENMVVNDTEIILKRKKKKDVSMIVNDIEIFENQMLVEDRKNYSGMQKLIKTSLFFY